MIIYLFLVLTSISGLALCGIIELFYYNTNSLLLGRFCSTQKNSSCNNVLTSSYSRVFKRLQIVDVGLVYFIWQLLTLLLLGVEGKSDDAFIMLTIPCVIATAFSVLAVWLQAYKIKNWCKLCISITIIIWSQLALTTFEFQLTNGYYSAGFFRAPWQENLLPDLLVSAICLLIASAWLLVVPQISRANEVTNTRKQILRWRYNPYVFAASVKMQRKVASSPIQNDFVLGNLNGHINLTTAINTYCQACSKEYKLLLEILRNEQSDISVTFKFRVDNTKPNRYSEATLYLLRAYKYLPAQAQESILTDWFTRQDLKAFKEKYPMPFDGEDKLMKEQEEWFKTNSILQTPTLFINGYELPQPYSAHDLKMLIPALNRKKIAI